VLALVIDASSEAVTAGVVDLPETADPGAPLSGARTVGLRTVIDGRAHAELLAIGAREAVAQAGAVMADLRAVVAGSGPGPYTGLRVGMVTAASFADALGIAVYGVCSLDGIGLALPTSEQTGQLTAQRVLVASDARRKEIYWAVYENGRRIGEPQVHRPAEVAEMIPALDVQAMAGAGARMYADVLGLMQLDVDFPQVDALASFAAQRIRIGAPSEPLEPMYLRRPDAVEPTGIAKTTLGHGSTGEPAS
jgi:tRNA threonylcarbamoyl adenosine modification protein YeaZ